MSPGAKIFWIGAGGLGLFGVLALAASKKASAAPKGSDTVVVPPHDAAPPVTVPAEPEGGFSRTDPFGVPGVQDPADASRILGQWFAAEGKSLVAADHAADAPTVPIDFGSQPADLNGSFGARVKQVAAAFQHYNGLVPEDGVLTNPLLLALRRWQQSQQLPDFSLPPAQSATPPAPIVLQSPSSGPPPFVPQAAPPPVAVTPPPAVPVVLPAPLPPVLLPTLPLPAPPAAPPMAPAVPVASPAAPPPVVAPPAPPATPMTPPPAAQAPSAVASDTAAMVNALLSAESRSGWNTIDPAVQAWQKSRPPLKVDGKYGPKTALMVAEEFGTVPIIRFWPKGSQKTQALQDYRAALNEIANHTTDPTKAAQLRVSAKREQAQSFGVQQGKAPALPSTLQVSIAKVA